MPSRTEDDTIRILVSTDNHVGYAERDPLRKDDSWRTFDEVLILAREHDVDMVLLAGDLFHDNKPSRQAMYQVMRSLRVNCLGEKPCELEMLSDRTESFEGAFSHVNYEDPDINVSIPVFSIHGNHDDPTGDSHLAALDLLQVGGLLNYYGRTHESDNVEIKPVLLQKGHTKLALFGMSNVRDERLFRTFRDGRVKFFRPAQQADEWFNLMSVHQNRHAYTDSGYLPENFLPGFVDLVIWGHEHESLIYPRKSEENGFDIIQPGSTVATSLVPGEAERKHVTILSITGREYKSDPIALKTVRPFKTREVILSGDPVASKLAKKDNNRAALTRHLTAIVEEMIKQAQAEAPAQPPRPTPEASNGTHSKLPEKILPLIRLRVEYTPPEGGNFDLENPQRFSNRFVGKVANVNDVVQFHRRKRTAVRQATVSSEEPAVAAASRDSIEKLEVGKLVHQYLTAQSLTILPQNSFGDAVTQFVEKDDRHAMEAFVEESLKSQVDHLLDFQRASGEDVYDHDPEVTLQKRLEKHKAELEKTFQAGEQKMRRRRGLKPQPEDWDEDLDGNWADNPAAIIRSDLEDGPDEAETAEAPPKSRAAARGGARQTAGATNKSAANGSVGKTRQTTLSMKTKSRRKQPSPESEEDPPMLDDNADENDDEDAVMLDSGADHPAQGPSQPLFVDSPSPPPPPARTTKRTAAAAASKKPIKTASTRAPARKAPASTGASQTSAHATRGTASSKSNTLSGVAIGTDTGVGRRTRGSVPTMPEDIDDDDDEDDAFEPVTTKK